MGSDPASMHSLADLVPDYLHSFSIPTPFPVGPVNVYLAEGDGLALIDTGPRYTPARRALEEALAGLGYSVADLERIILTHAHGDHCGLAGDLARRSGAQVLTHAVNVPRLDEGAGGRRLTFYRQILRWAGVPPWTMLRLARSRRTTGRYATAVVPDRTLADGDRLSLGGEPWSVLHTPGHTGGVICLYQSGRRLLISSDHLIRDISSNPVVEGPAPGETERPRSLVNYLAQLRRVAELDVALALPGHGPPITDHRELIAERLAFHQARAEHILQILGGRTLTTHRLAQTLFPGRDPINTFFAISEVIGHLEWLEMEGRVERVERFGVARWRRATRGA